jgi:glycosyltransferase involved in cell wall biosynthesis
MSAPWSSPDARPLRVVRVIARLNVGGPALHAVLATAGLRPDVQTTLAVGRVGPDEMEATDLLERFDVKPVRIPGLGRSISPVADLRAFSALVRLYRRVRPDVVHTHTAKAGAVGRLAARMAGVPHVVHTFHGHVFDGYFGRGGSKAAVRVERSLAKKTDRVVAVSEEVGRDLVERFGVVPREKLVVVPVGVPLDDYLACGALRGSLRRELSLPGDAPLVAMVGRLVPVKDASLALDAWRLVRRELPSATLVVVGDGEEGAALRARAEPGVVFLGWRRDVATIWADADLALLTSRNEGTPVSLIEAAASGVPAVATRVGGVPSVVEEGVTGTLVPSGDAAALAAAVVALLAPSPGTMRRQGGATMTSEAACATSTSSKAPERMSRSSTPEPKADPQSGRCPGARGATSTSRRKSGTRFGKPGARRVRLRHGVFGATNSTPPTRTKASSWVRTATTGRRSTS